MAPFKQPFEKGTLAGAVLDGDVAQVEKLLKNCGTRDEIDDVWDRRTAFMAAARKQSKTIKANTYSQILEAIWDRYKLVGCDLKEVLTQTMNYGPGNWNVFMNACKCGDIGIIRQVCGYYEEVFPCGQERNAIIGRAVDWTHVDYKAKDLVSKEILGQAEEEFAALTNYGKRRRAARNAAQQNNDGVRAEKALVSSTVAPAKKKARMAESVASRDKNGDEKKKKGRQSAKAKGGCKIAPARARLATNRLEVGNVAPLKGKETPQESTDRAPAARKSNDEMITQVGPSKDGASKSKNGDLNKKPPAEPGIVVKQEDLSDEPAIWIDDDEEGKEEAEEEEAQQDTAPPYLNQKSPAEPDTVQSNTSTRIPRLGGAKMLAAIERRLGLSRVIDMSMPDQIKRIEGIYSPGCLPEGSLIVKIQFLYEQICVEN